MSYPHFRVFDGVCGMIRVPCTAGQQHARCHSIVSQILQIMTLAAIDMYVTCKGEASELPANSSALSLAAPSALCSRLNSCIMTGRS